MFEEIFKRRKLNVEKLISYGFVADANAWHYQTEIKDGEFTLDIRITEDGSCGTSLTEKDSGDEYILYKTAAFGSYVGEIRTAVEEILTDISDKCYEPQVFKTRQAKVLIGYVRSRYSDESYELAE